MRHQYREPLRMMQRSGLLSANKDVELTFCTCETRSLCSHPGCMGVLANGFSDRGFEFHLSCAGTSTSTDP